MSEIDQYLWMVGGSAGALALTGVAAASAFYLSTRPKPEKPLVTLHEQSLLEMVNIFYLSVLDNFHRACQPFGTLNLTYALYRSALSKDYSYQR